MKLNNRLNALTEILATAVQGNEQMKQDLHSLLGADTPAPVEKKTAQQRRDEIKRMFTRLAIKEKLKQHI